MGDRSGNFKTFTVTKPSFDNWRVEKYYDNGDLHLKNLFQQFSSGARAELLQLLNQWATQQGNRFNATLNLLDSNQQIAACRAY